jgi:ribosomal protein S18 acetylase RimI-like enzyme
MDILAEKEGIVFKRMERRDIEQTAELLSRIFSAKEPVLLALGISCDEYRNFAEFHCEKAAEEGLSVVAADKATGNIVGFSISEDLLNPHQEENSSFSKKIEADLACISELQDKYKAIQPVEEGEALHIFLLGVGEGYERRNIAKTLVTENLRLAKTQNFTTAIAEASGAVSQHIFRSLGFQEQGAIEYKSYTFNGEKVFRAIEHPTSYILMSKKIE